MKNHAVPDKVRRVLAEEFELDHSQIEPDARLYEALGLDSLDSVDLIVALEREFGFRIDRSADDVRLKEIRTVQDVCDFVDTKLSAAGEN